MADDDNTESKMVPDKPMNSEQFEDYIASILDVFEEEDFSNDNLTSLTFDEWMERITKHHHAVD